ncbi:asparagine synthase-related protein [Candidatus Pelagibacter sp.]|nr:asparagine synthase-related protein [Candidatus Pelagibacter sp.]|tara:strand:- start:280 stop:1914 length:1635 start_codon:yes stop_codon:yes gene_type:complete
MKKEIKIQNSLIMGWNHIEKDASSFWYKGYLNNSNFEKVFINLQKIKFDELNSYINNLDGNFSFIFKNEFYTLASVDKISSTPLFYHENENNIIISPHIFMLKEFLQNEKYDPISILSIKMAGYTIGNNTLISKLKKINCGEYFFLKKNDENYTLNKYYTYLPQSLGLDDSLENYKHRYLNDTFNVFEKLYKRSKEQNKKIAVSMSAGLDTRLIVSALKEIGADNIIGFSYGLKNNFEANGAKDLCKYLNIPWKFSKYTNSKLNKIIQTKNFREFREKTDTLYSSSSYIDFFAVKELTDNSFLKNSIIVNGHSGDFIAGNHMLTQFYDSKYSNNFFKNAAKAILDKHFRLWLNLANKKNDEIIENLLVKQMQKLNMEIKDPKQIFGVIENIQLEDRQSKHCLSRQRNYEFLGLDWALPLWDRDYLEFWEKIPFELKLNRKLFVDTLYKKNLQFVWSGKKWSKLGGKENVNPILVRILRFLMKFFFIFSKNKWKIFDKKYFNYWYDICCGYAHIDYPKVILQKKIFRNCISWQTKSYLEKKMIDL